MVRDAGDLFLHILRELPGQVIGTDDGQDVHARIVHVSQDLRDLSLRGLVRAAVVCDLHHDLVAVHGAHGVLAADKDVCMDLSIVRRHVSRLVLSGIGADKRGCAALDDAGDLRLLTAFSLSDGCSVLLPLREESHLHRIMIEGAPRLIRGNEEISLHAVHGNEAKASCIGLEYALKIYVLTVVVQTFSSAGSPLRLCCAFLSSLSRLL